MIDPNGFSWISKYSIKEYFEIIVFIICIIFLCDFLYQKIKNLLHYYGITNKNYREKEKHIKQLEENTSDINDLKEISVETINSINKIIPLIDDINNSSKEINNKLNILTKDVNILKEEVNKVKEKQQIQEEVNRKSTLAKHKDRLYQAYRYYKSRAVRENKKEWTSIEKDGFTSMLNDYIDNNGNGYVHNEVVPFMNDFVVNDDR